MPRVTVYHFFTFASSQLSVRSRRAATREAIEKLGGVVLEQTAREVDESLLDASGFVDERKLSE